MFYAWQFELDDICFRGIPLLYTAPPQPKSFTSKFLYVTFDLEANKLSKPLLNAACRL